MTTFLIRLKNDADLNLIKTILNQFEIEIEPQTDTAHQPTASLESTDPKNEVQALANAEKKPKHHVFYAQNGTLSIPFYTLNGAKTTSERLERIETSRKIMLEMVENGFTSSNYGDPVEWQRETRKDRPLPFRD